MSGASPRFKELPDGEEVVLHADDRRPLTAVQPGAEDHRGSELPILPRALLPMCGCLPITAQQQGSGPGSGFVPGRASAAAEQDGDHSDHLLGLFLSLADERLGPSGAHELDAGDHGPVHPVTSRRKPTLAMLSSFLRSSTRSGNTTA